jgi:hypothetical protein
MALSLSLVPVLAGPGDPSLADPSDTNGRLDSARPGFAGPGCRRVCLNLVPDAGAVQRPIPGAPSPTPTLLPSLPPVTLG